MKTETGVSSRATVDFQNPADHAIRCDLSLSSGTRNLFDTRILLIVSLSCCCALGTHNPFRILLDKLENISLGPRETFPIPIAYCPETLVRQEAQLRVIARLPSGITWSSEK